MMTMGLTILPLYSDGADYIGKKIVDIKFEGIINAPELDLKAIISIQPGQALTQESLNRDLKRIFETGYFSDIKLRILPVGDDSITVIYQVKERPRIDRIDFLGVEELYPADLRTSLPYKEGSVYSSQKVLDGKTVLQRKYRDEGFFLAEVWVKTSEIDPETNTLNITYIVDEGEDISVSKINIIGTKKLNPENIMKILEQKEEGFFEDAGFLESRFEEDKFRILAFAKSQGFLDAAIVKEDTGYEIRWRNPSKPEEGRVVVITYTIDEGPIYYYGGYSLEHDTNAINEELNPPERRLVKPGEFTPVYEAVVILDNLEYLNYSMGEVYDESKYFRDRQFIQDLYSQRGYVYAQVVPNIIEFPLTKEILDRYEQCLQIDEPQSQADERCKQEAGWIDLSMARERLDEYGEEEGNTLRHVHFVIREHKLAYIENIIVKGMVKTQEKVIRRELLMKEGQLFNKALVDRSREKLINTGFFKEVNLQMRPGSDDQKMNLIIDVQEQPTGTISMGGGYGTASGFSIFVEGGETNLNGTGRKVNGRLQYGPTVKEVGLTYTDPWFYEACEDNTGSFWKKKQKQFDEAESLDSIAIIAESLQNDYSVYRDRILEYIEDARKDREEVTLEDIDTVKVRIRSIIKNYVAKEEDCFRSAPRPWALSMQLYYRTSSIRFDASNAIQVSDTAADMFEGASYDIESYGIGMGLSHTFLVNWAHYHRYMPSFSRVTQPTALVSSSIIEQEKLGWQFKSSLTNGIVYDTRDNVFSPTSGFSIDISMETVGQFLGGDDHFNEYKASSQTYWWWFDYTFGGLFRNNKLKRWRVVQEVRFSGVFSHETTPYGKSQDKDINPYMEVYDHHFLGGYETLRGYSYADPSYPLVWRDGGNHMLLFSTELRFPIEPSILWLVAFFDGGSLYDNVGEYTGTMKKYLDEYDSNINALKSKTDPAAYWVTDHYNYLKGMNFFGSYYDWNDPRNAVLSARNVSLHRMLFSYGVGLRVQIPVLPLRLYLAKKVYYAGRGAFRPLPGDSNWEFVFGIGDYRFR